ncbi:MAG: CYTH domain-containing protein, partial [Marinobacter sp.]|nr:CYTH domain-containing protein [Marinobacter sp.]
MARELEIKMSLTAEDQDEAADWLLAQPGASEGATNDLVNIYYDTLAGDLNRQAIALRVRQSGNRFIQTLKTRGEFVDGAHHRQEWEWPLADARLNLDLIASTPACEHINLAALRPMFETNFRRRTVMLRDDAAEIECALDRGHIVADGRTLALIELELELKAGADQQLVQWARRVADRVPLFVNLISKAEQGY